VERKEETKKTKRRSTISIYAGYTDRIILYF